MSRSLRKGPYIQESLEKKVLAMNEGTKKKEVIKTWSRLRRPVHSKDIRATVNN